MRHALGRHCPPQGKEYPREHPCLQPGKDRHTGCHWHFKRHANPYREIQAARSLFPVLPNKKEASHKDYKKIQRRVNECLKKIGKELNLDMKLTFYVARHTWASQAHEMDIPLAAISQALGHRSEDTTLIYLAELSQEKLNKSYEKVTKSVNCIVCASAWVLISKIRAIYMQTSVNQIFNL